MIRITRTWIALLVFSMAGAHADVIELNNGDRITGTLEGISTGKALIATSYAGTVAVNMDEISSMTSDREFRVRTSEGFVHGRFAPGVDGQTILSSDGTATVAMGDIRSASEDKLALTQLAREFSNRADVGLVISNGNSDTESFNTLIESVYKKDRVQHLASLLIASEEAEEQKTRDQLDLDYNYRRFMSEKWFVAGNAEYFTDRLKDIDSRITLGAGAGYQFWDNTFGAFSAEAGISAVREEINGAEENNPAFRFALDYKKLLLAKRMELFHKQSILVIPDADRGEVISASTGVRYAISDWIDTMARVDVNHETKPAPGNSKTDTTYTVGVGIKF